MSDVNETISTEEVNQVLNVFNFMNFAESYRDSYYNTYFTPDIVNQQMQNINMNPIDINVSDIVNALKNPKKSEDILRNYSSLLELNNMYYHRLIQYLSNMPCFNLTFDCINITKDSEYRSKEFKNDLKIVEDFLNKFNYRYEFKTILRQMIRQGVFYGILREDGDRYTIQELPSNYCKITGRHSYGILYDFNMQYFIGQAGVDINMFPRIFKHMYRNVYSQISRDYDPAQKVNKRHSTFVYWHQCNPKYGFWAFKVYPELTTMLPYFAPLFPDISMTPIVRKLQEDKYFIEASKLLVGILGFNKDTKSGQVANQVNITPEVLGKFLGLARQGLNKQIGLTALPVDEVKVVEFDTSDTNLVDEQTKIVANQSVASAATLFNDTKLSVHQSKLAAAIDANIVKQLYPIFSNFMEYYINMKTHKYKFSFEFHDVDIPDDRDYRQTLVKDMSAMGIVDFQTVGRVYNLNIFELNRRLKLSNNFDFGKQLSNMLIPNMFFNNNDTSDANSNNVLNKKVGRPAKPNSDNENTIASVERGSNELKESLS